MRWTGVRKSTQPRQSILYVDCRAHGTIASRIRRYAVNILHNACSGRCRIAVEKSNPAKRNNGIQTTYQRRSKSMDFAYNILIEHWNWKKCLQILQSLCEKVNDPALIEPYTKFYVEVMDSARVKRLPRYDYLYEMFDDALYNGRDRSKRIVFDWLTEEQKADAMNEIVPSIKSIVFAGRNSDKN